MLPLIYSKHGTGSLNSLLFWIQCTPTNSPATYGAQSLKYWKRTIAGLCTQLAVVIFVLVNSLPIDRMTGQWPPCFSYYLLIHSSVHLRTCGTMEGQSVSRCLPLAETRHTCSALHLLRLSRGGIGDCAAAIDGTDRVWNPWEQPTDSFQASCEATGLISSGASRNMADTHDGKDGYTRVANGEGTQTQKGMICACCVFWYTYFYIRLVDRQFISDIL